MCQDVDVLCASNGERHWSLVSASTNNQNVHQLNNIERTDGSKGRRKFDISIRGVPHISDKAKHAKYSYSP